MFFRTLWTVKPNFLVKELGAVALNYLEIQEIDPRMLVYLFRSSLPLTFSHNVCLLPALDLSMLGAPQF